MIKTGYISIKFSPKSTTVLIRTQYGLITSGDIKAAFVWETREEATKSLMTWLEYASENDPNFINSYWTILEVFIVVDESGKRKRYTVEPTLTPSQKIARDADNSDNINMYL